jgi:hypothetical protein
MKELNLNLLLGKTIKSISSSFLIAENNGTEFIEFRMDYKSSFVIDAVIKWNFQKIFIHSDWHENLHGQDLLSISLSIGEMFSGRDKEYLTMPYPSSIAIWGGFKIKQIDLYGYNKDFNLIEPTKHILLIRSFDDRKMLIRPGCTALGLIVTLSDLGIHAFFNESLNCELIYRVETFMLENI